MLRNGIRCLVVLVCAGCRRAAPRPAPCPARSRRPARLPITRRLRPPELAPAPAEPGGGRGNRAGSPRGTLPQRRQRSRPASTAAASSGTCSPTRDRRAAHGSEQFRAGRSVRATDLQPGDLVFFDNERPAAPRTSGIVDRRRRVRARAELARRGARRAAGGALLGQPLRRRATRASAVSRGQTQV